MSVSVESLAEDFDPAERAALAALAEQLWNERPAIAAEWSESIAAVRPQDFEPRGPLTPDVLRFINEAFLTAVLAPMREGDLTTLCTTYYQLNRRLIDVERERTLGRRVHLADLYESARFATASLEARIPPSAVFGKLTTRLTMLVGLAYSDAREEALEAARDELQHVVTERTAALASQKSLADTIIETLPGLFFLIDHNERILRWNEELERVSGCSAAEIAARHPLEFFAPETRAHLADKMREAFVAGTANAEAELIAEDGTRHARWFTSKRVMLSDGPALVGVGIDISERRAAEERTTREKELSDNIIGSLPGVFYMFNDQGQFLRWNETFATVSQYSGEEIARMHPTEFFEGEGREHIGERIGQVLLTGHATAEADFVSKDGSRAPYFFTGQRVMVDGRPCVIGMGIDVTERKRATEAMQRAKSAQLFATLLESAPDAMVVSDRSGTIVFANSQTERLFGIPRERLLGQPLGSLVPTELRERPRDPDGPPVTISVEADGRRADGSTVPVEIKLRRIETDDGPLLTSALRDITDRRRAEAEIRRLNTDLELRVVERTRELERSNADLEQFAYVASHDLQEPLRAVASFTQLLARRYRDRLDGDALRFIDRTGAAVTRMQALIRDLLAYSRVGTRADGFTLIDCEQMLADVLDDLHAGIAETEAVVTHDPLPSIAGDASQLRQLFQNLVGNAIKFRGTAAPRVHIAVRRDGELWRFAVSDNGIGIESDYTERVFVIFQRLHSRRDYPGTGVGLAICKRIVEGHGGRIWVESAIDRGTTVRFDLPAVLVEPVRVAAAGD
jgi:PAS domain S-box-containing protein